jgi:hypothetical protein
MPLSQTEKRSCLLLLACDFFIALWIALLTAFSCHEDNSVYTSTILSAFHPPCCFLMLLRTFIAAAIEVLPRRSDLPEYLLLSLPNRSAHRLTDSDTSFGLIALFTFPAPNTGKSFGQLPQWAVPPKPGSKQAGFARFLI